MSLTGFNKIFEVNESEYAYNPTAYKPVAGGKTITLYVPKLMGAITSIGSENIIINGLFDNAKECMPVYNKKVTKSKSFSPTVKDNCNWLDKLTSGGYIPANSRFTVEFLNGNIATPVVTTK